MMEDVSVIDCSAIQINVTWIQIKLETKQLGKIIWPHILKLQYSLVSYFWDSDFPKVFCLAAELLSVLGCGVRL